jgi:hypothetical protein
VNFLYHLADKFLARYVGRAVAVPIKYPKAKMLNTLKIVLNEKRLFEGRITLISGTLVNFYSTFAYCKTSVLPISLQSLLNFSSTTTHGSLSENLSNLISDLIVRLKKNVGTCRICSIQSLNLAQCS